MNIREQARSAFSVIPLRKYIEKAFPGQRQVFWSWDSQKFVDSANRQVGVLPTGYAVGLVLVRQSINNLPGFAAQEIIGLKDDVERLAKQTNAAISELDKISSQFDVECTSEVGRRLASKGHDVAIVTPLD